MSMTGLAIFVLSFCLTLFYLCDLSLSRCNGERLWKRSKPSGPNYWWKVENPWKNLPGLKKNGNLPPKDSLATTQSIQAEPECQCVPTFRCDPESGRIADYGTGMVDFRVGPSCPDDMICCLPPDESNEDEELANEGTQNYKLQAAFNDCGIVTDIYTLKGNAVVSRFSIANDRIGTDQGQFPWTLALMLRSKVGEIYKCGASLLSATIAVTAAHCVEGLILSNLILIAGEWDLELDGELIQPQHRGVKDIKIHPYYSRRPIMNDIALLEVDTPFERNAFVNNICLPTKNDRFEDALCYAAGWNVQADGSTLEDRKLKKAKLSIMPFIGCQARYQRPETFGPLYRLHDSFLCAGGVNGEDTCKGDGGGPLGCTWREDERFYLVGVTSWGYGCGTMPGAYTNVSVVEQWINQVVSGLLV